MKNKEMKKPHLAIHHRSTPRLCSVKIPHYDTQRHGPMDIKTQQSCLPLNFLSTHNGRWHDPLLGKSVFRCVQREMSGCTHS